jgi:secondary thiamine-phosphate synthase enzyme
MRQASHRIEVATRGKGLYEITAAVEAWVRASGIREGLLTLFVRHTSASLAIQENASPEVLDDLERFFTRLVPEDNRLYEHTIEGPDDMPAHIRTAVTPVSISIPVSGGRPELGTWQGIFLFEHRSIPHRRSVALHLSGE